MRIINTSLPEAFRLKAEIEDELKAAKRGNETVSFCIIMEKFLEIEHCRNKEDLPKQEARVLDRILSALKVKLQDAAIKTLNVSKEAINRLQSIKGRKIVPLRDIAASQDTLLKLLLGELYFRNLHQKIDRKEILSYWMTEFSLLPEAPITKQLLTPELDFFKNQFEMRKAG